MAIAGIPEIINNFNLYLSGRRLLGHTGQVKTPDFEAILSETAGAGIIGSYNAIAIGHYNPMEQEVPFRCIDDDYYKLIKPHKAIELTLRGSIQYSVQATQDADWMGMRIVYRGRCKNIVTGNIRQHMQMEASITMELTYILIEMDGKPRVEYDKINEVFKILGEDMLTKIKSQC